MRWAGHVARMSEERGTYRILVGKPEGKKPLGRPRLRWVDNIKMDLQEVGCGYVNAYFEAIMIYVYILHINIILYPQPTLVYTTSRLHL